MHVSIRVKDHLNPCWQEWFSGLQITQEPQGTSLFTGPLPDQAALFGVLLKIRNLNLRLLALAVEEETDLSG
jgi:hypothetical protein